MQQAFTAMENNNMTIILEQRVAQEYNLKVGDTIAIDFRVGRKNPYDCGFIWSKNTKQSNSNRTGGGQIIGEPGPGIYQIYPTTLTTWSYVPRNLFNMSSPSSDAFKDENFDTTILLKLNPGVNGTAVAEKIGGLNLEIYGVTSFDEQWQQTQNSK